MNICIFINSVIPVTKYGGTQRVMWDLGKELSRAHIGEGKNKVYFLAKKGSVCDFATVIPYDPARGIDEQIPEDVDIIHFNGGTLETKRPYIVTYHGNRTPEVVDMNAVFVSADHARRHGSRSFVYNGLDWDAYGPVNLDAERTHYHFLGNAAWRVKNVKGAINVVKALPGERIKVMGGVRLNFKMGFRFTLTPKARFMGMVGGTEKTDCLQHSKGLVFPVMWDEPFGLAITESLYFGAPVFGTPYGSLPELVTPDVGFLTNRQDEMTAHLKSGAAYSPKTCHEYARDKFNSRLMAEAYMAKYEAVLNGQTLNDTRPLSSDKYTIREWMR